MSDFDDKWTMHGRAEDDPECLHTPAEALEYINRVGLLPLFRNEIRGFSLEEQVSSRYWWSDEADKDPWIWRQTLAAGGRVAYGKFFCGRAGFVSLDILPLFASARRDGYDFDTRLEEGLVRREDAEIMKTFETCGEMLSSELKKRIASKRFDAAVTRLQHQTYLAIKDFRTRVNKKGEPYGWHVGVYARPEDLWGAELVRSAYMLGTQKAISMLTEHMRSLYPHAAESDIKKQLL